MKATRVVLAFFCGLFALSAAAEPDVSGLRAWLLPSQWAKQRIAAAKAAGQTTPTN